MLSPERTSSPFPEIDPDLLADCIHCGLCLETCPTFVQTGREEESPRGRLLLMNGLSTGRWGPEDEVRGHLDLCLGCRACETACPSGVQYGRLLEETRAALRNAGGYRRSPVEDFLVDKILRRGRMLERLVVIYRALSLWRLLRAMGGFPMLPRPWRLRLRLAPRPETPVKRTSVPRSSGPCAVVFRGCVARALFPGTEAAMMELLHRSGYRVVRLGEPECCGALAEHLGDRTRTRELGRKMLAEVPENAILIPTAAGCGAHLKALPHVLGGDVESANDLAGRVRDLSEALLEAPTPLSFQGAPPVRVVYQDACHLRHGQGIADQPRELLTRSGALLIDAGDEDLCCGSAGTYNLARPELAWRIGRSKAKRLVDSGTRTVVTSNPGCAIQLEAVLPETMEVVSFARFLCDRLSP